jgi:hypothetical protein
MEKGHLLAPCSRDRLLVDEFAPGILGVLKLGTDIISGIGHMMNTLSILGQKFGNRTLLRRRFQEFNMGVSHLKKGSPDLLRFNFLNFPAF